jgi:hypothetical protein
MSQSPSNKKQQQEPAAVSVDSQTSSLVEVKDASFNENLQALQLQAESDLPARKVLIPIIVLVDTRKRLTFSPRQSKRISQECSGR